METTIKKFRKGQRVVYNPENAVTTAPSGWKEGILATIVNSKNLLIQFDEHVDGHSGDGNIPDGTGWYVSPQQLTIIPKVKQPKKQVDPLAEFFDILSTLPEDELKDLLGEAKGRQKKVYAEKYYEFENEYELNGDLLGKPLHIRMGLANDGFERKEIGFNSELTPIICKGYGDNIEEIELTSSHYIRFKVN